MNRPLFAYRLCPAHILCRRGRCGMRWLEGWNTLLWQWVLPVMMTSAAALCAVKLHGRPLRGFGRSVRRACGTLLRQDPASAAQRRVSANALAAVMGTGNLVGTAAALLAGGAGAVFWMWVSGLLGMVLVYAENLLGRRWQCRCADGTGCGGTLAMLREGMHSRGAAAFFAVCCACAGLGMGDLAQSSTIAQTAAGFGIPRVVCGLITAILLYLILHGGKNRGGHFTAALMPLICVLYLAGCAALLLRNRQAIPAAFARIMREALGLRAVGGGWSAAIMMRSLSVGLRRGVFSNEAGLGTSALLHMDAGRSGAEQGNWAALEVFADTVLCCTLTALVILTAGGTRTDESAAMLLLQAFSGGLGRSAGGFLALCMILLAFATLVGWYPCGAAAFRYLFGRGAEKVWLAGYILLAFAGAFGGYAWVWAVCDCCNGMMALPNLIGLMRLSHLLPECEKDAE